MNAGEEWMERRSRGCTTAPQQVNFKLFCAIAVATILTACANTVGELKADKASFDGVVTSSESYLATYRLLRTVARQCLEHAPLGTPVTTESELDSEMKEGQIRQKITGQGVLLTTTVIDVKAGTDDKGLISLYTLKGSLATGIKIPKLTDIKRWIAGDTRCAL
jgi:hypothetical protein